MSGSNRVCCTFASFSPFKEIPELDRVPVRGVTRAERTVHEMVLNAWERIHDACTVLQDRPPEIQAVPDDPDDDRVIATALAAGVDMIISGDRHLLKVGEYEGIKIVRLSDFLEGPSRGR